jgi:hypothetical protein
MGGNAQQVAGRRQHLRMAKVGCMVEGGTQATHRPEARPRPIGKRREAAPLTPHNGEGIALGGKRIGHMADQFAPLVHVQRLVGAEAAGAAAGEDRAEDGQAVSSNSSRPTR